MRTDHVVVAAVVLSGPYAPIAFRSLSRMPGQVMEPLEYEHDFVHREKARPPKKWAASPLLLCGIVPPKVTEAPLEWPADDWWVVPLRVCQITRTSESQSFLGLEAIAWETLDPAAGDASSLESLRPRLTELLRPLTAGDEGWDARPGLMARGHPQTHPYLVADFEVADRLWEDVLAVRAETPACCARDPHGARHQVEQLRRKPKPQALLEDADRWLSCVRYLQNSGPSGPWASSPESSLAELAGLSQAQARLVAVFEDGPEDGDACQPVDGRHLRLSRRAGYRLEIRTRSSREAQEPLRLRAGGPPRLVETQLPEIPALAGTQRTFIYLHAKDRPGFGVLQCEGVVDGADPPSSEFVLAVPFEVTGQPSSTVTGAFFTTALGAAGSVGAVLLPADLQELADIAAIFGVLLLAIGLAALAWAFERHR